MSTSRKRKNRPGKSYNLAEDAPVDFSPDPALFIQAYEAEIIRGPQAKEATDSLDFSQYLSPRGDRPGPSGLVQLNPTGLHTAPAFPSDVDDGFLPAKPTFVNRSSVWVDRYDARLLLDALPPKSDPRVKRDVSPSGWSDLPSDSEDTFFFSPREADDYRQEKRRKLMDQAREERLRARRAEDGEPEEEEAEVWGGSDEEPDDAQTLLMQRTAASIMATANPAQLEMRILANYGADKRFAFLRGRWKEAWSAMKRKEALKGKLKEDKKAEAGLGNLADYGDSDEEEEDEQPNPEAVLAARQARAKAWAESRRAAKSNSTDVL
ncbi:hypothetical protein C8F04DRAFT_1140819 [Mycena alexandri]|uniref:Uncharacterized protein n=1 Tax=Mycena alexandri TaxID=1745969 RepID=A0AAD6S574_9AGAR|nr:hypothetical protein C8F04DRAFT_1140819 [Mycena alexandri]